MKKIQILLVALLIILLAPGNTMAQMASPVAIGLRGTPDGGGLTGKFFLDRNWALELQLNGSGGTYMNNDGPSMTLVGLMEYHIILPDPSWRIFLGPGIHFGTWDRYGNGFYDNYNNGNAEGIFGIDGILGIEYVFKSIPFGISADIKPAVNFASQVAFFPNNFFGLSGRFYLGRPFPHQRPVPQPYGRD